MATILVGGRLGRDPQTIEGKNGKFISVSMAEDFGKDKTRWWDLTFNGEGLIAQVERMKLKKGSAINVVGRYGTRQYTDRNGVEQTVPVISVSQVDFAMYNSGNTSSDSSATNEKEQNEIKKAMETTAKKPTPKVEVKEEEDLPF